MRKKVFLLYFDKGSVVELLTSSPVAVLALGMCKARERPDLLRFHVVEDLLSSSATPGIQFLPDIWV